MAESGDNNASPSPKKTKTELTVTATDSAESPFRFSDEVTMEQIRQVQRVFVTERDWDQYHVPRNLLLAMVGEVGELSELFQWKGEVKNGLPGWSEKERTQLSQEMGDVFIYLMMLAEKCHIDLPKAVLDKIEHNRRKYPAHLAYGSCKKYTEYTPDPE